MTRGELPVELSAFPVGVGIVFGHGGCADLDGFVCNDFDWAIGGVVAGFPYDDFGGAFRHVQSYHPVVTGGAAVSADPHQGVGKRCACRGIDDAGVSTIFFSEAGLTLASSWTPGHSRASYTLYRSVGREQQMQLGGHGGKSFPYRSVGQTMKAPSLCANTQTRSQCVLHQP